MDGPGYGGYGCVIINLLESRSRATTKVRMGQSGRQVGHLCLLVWPVFLGGLNRTSLLFHEMVARVNLEPCQSARTRRINVGYRETWPGHVAVAGYFILI